MLIDYHVHTNTSTDAVPGLHDYCKRAVELGFDELCITNHHEWISVVDGKYEYAMTGSEIKQLINEVEVAKKEFPLNIKFGVELGFHEMYEKEILDFSKKHPFDYIIGSVHVVNGEMIAGEEPLVDMPIEIVNKRYAEYFRLLKRAIELGFCDCVGHFELPRKEMPQLEFADYKKLVKPCIDAMKRNNVGFELNTGGWRRYQNDAYPRKEILDMFYKAGIKKITVGSDCHKVDEFGYRVSEGLRVLKEAGFENICTFSKREPSFWKIQ